MSQVQHLRVSCGGDDPLELYGIQALHRRGLHFPQLHARGTSHIPPITCASCPLAFSHGQEHALSFGEASLRVCAPPPSWLYKPPPLVLPCPLLHGAKVRAPRVFVLFAFCGAPSQIATGLAQATEPVFLPYGGLVSSHL